MVLGEGLLVGAGSGLLSVALTYLVVNVWYGGIPFPIAFFPAFKIPVLAFAWGPLIGGRHRLGRQHRAGDLRHVRQRRPGVFQDGVDFRRAAGFTPASVDEHRRA